MIITFIILQNKISKDPDTVTFKEQDLVLKVGECLQARITTFYIFFYHQFSGKVKPVLLRVSWTIMLGP